MADVNIDKFRVSTVRPNTTPANSGNVTTEPQVPVNPPGSGGTTFGGAGAGLSIDGIGRVQLGNDGAGVVNISDTDVFSDGLEFRYDLTNVDLDERYVGRITLNEDEVLLQSRFRNPVSDILSLTTEIEIDRRLINIEKDINSSIQGILFDNISDLITITDQINSKGLEYAADYSANWTDHSLVTKSWVLGQISGSGHNPVTIGSPANGLSISGTQVLSLGLASSGATGALSSTDWSTFNGKLNLTSPITGYTVGANTALADTDSILSAFGKVQGQINARISGTIASGQIAFGTGVNTVGGDANMTYTTGRLTINRFADTRITLQDNGTTTLLLQALSTAGRISGSNTDLPIEFWTGGTYRWGIIAAGILQSNGAQTIRSSTGNLTIGTNGGNGNILLTPNGTGVVGIATTSPTNTLDVNGTARIRTISNLGTAATSVLVPSATGVVRFRTLAELASDGLGSKWTDVSGGIFRNGAVAIGRNTIPSNNTFSVRSTSVVDGNVFFLIEDNAGVSRIQSTNNGLININGGPTDSNNGGVTVRGIVASTDGVNSIFRVYSSDNVEQFRIVGSGQASFVSPFLYVGNPTVPSGNAGMHVRGVSTSTDRIFTVMNNSNIIAFRVLGNLTSQFSGNLQIEGGSNIVLSTTTGTRIGTATNQRIGFWNATPIVQPTTAIVAGAFVANTSGIANDTATFGGYTMGQVVQALRNMGLLA